MYFLKISFLLLVACISSYSQAENMLRMSTTTSTENSGLLTKLNPVFEKKYNVRINVIAVGTGKALKLGENGDVDLVFVHAPDAEVAFVEAGFGIDRTAIMHNDFILVGDPADLAKLKEAKTIVEALHKIKKAKTKFISRGDDSGTHKKERFLWQMSNIEPVGDWYLQIGQGMAAALTMAYEKNAYILTDRGTYISLQDKIDLDIVFEGDKSLFNPYHIIAVNPEKYPHVQYKLAKQYIDFISGVEGQTIIATYKKAGQQLFYPDYYEGLELRNQ